MFINLFSVEVRGNLNSINIKESIKSSIFHI